MAIQNVIGDAIRGATWVALHNGGGVGWGEVVNGGFGLVLDGSEEAGERSQQMLDWDVNNGIGRRAWSGSGLAQWNAKRRMEKDERLRITIPVETEEDILERIVMKK
jgi:urocanate hydratase